MDWYWLGNWGGVGVAFDNIALGISIGILIGAAISLQQSRAGNKEDQEE